MRDRSARKQINIVIDDEIERIIDDIRAMTRPVPTVSDVVRQALRDQRDRLIARAARGR